MKILVTTTPGAGHVLPLTPLAVALQAAGHEVTWATGPDGGDLVRAGGLRAVAAGTDQPSRTRGLLELRPDLPTLAPRERRAVMFPVLFGTLSAAAMYDDLIPLVEADPPDVIVHDPSELAAAPLAARLGVPHVTVGFGRLIPPPLLSAAAAEVAPLWDLAGRAAPADCGVYDHLYLHPLPASFEPLPPDAPVHGLRPYHDHDWPFEPTIDEPGPPTVYLTFGTEFGRIAPWRDALEGLGSLPVQVLVTTGGQVDAADLGPLPASVRVERWVPQREALAGADLVVSHGGSGAVIGALGAGLPHLVLPLAADHFDNGDLVRSGGLGDLIEPGDVDAAAVAARAEHLLADAGTRQRAVAASGELAALSPTAAGVRHVESLVAGVPGA